MHREIYETWKCHHIKPNPLKLPYEANDEFVKGRTSHCFHSFAYLRGAAQNWSRINACWREERVDKWKKLIGKKWNYGFEVVFIRKTSVNLHQYVPLTIGSDPFQNEISMALKENIWFPGNNVVLCRHNLNLKTSTNRNLDSICLLKKKTS